MLSFVGNLYKKWRYKNNLRKANPYIDVSDSAILLESMRFDFRQPKKRKYVHIGDESVLGCSMIFESEHGEINVSVYSEEYGTRYPLPAALFRSLLSASTISAWPVSWIFSSSSCSESGTKFTLTRYSFS